MSVQDAVVQLPKKGTIRQTGSSRFTSGFSGRFSQENTAGLYRSSGGLTANVFFCYFFFGSACLFSNPNVTDWFFFLN